MKAIFEGGRVRAPCQTCDGALSTFSYKDETGEFDSVILSAALRRKNNVMKNITILAIRFYQLHAPLRLRACCRFTPTCSEYAIVKFNKHGVFRGIILSLNRFFRCRPPNGGIDEP